MLEQLELRIWDRIFLFGWTIHLSICEQFDWLKEANFQAHLCKALCNRLLRQLGDLNALVMMWNWLVCRVCHLLVKLRKTILHYELLFLQWPIGRLDWEICLVLQLLWLWMHTRAQNNMISIYFTFRYICLTFFDIFLTMFFFRIIQYTNMNFKF